MSRACTTERLEDRALLALQGPRAEAVLARLAPEVRSMRFMDFRAIEVMNAACTVSRSGYTGEDGFEISLPASHAEAVAQALLENSDVAMIGLGARDSLRLEAGLCLYGSELDVTTTPVEAALEWSIQKSGEPAAAVKAIFGRAKDPAPAREWRAAPARGLASGGEGANSPRCRALFGSRHSGRDRRGHVGRIWSQRQRTGCHGLVDRAES